MRWPLRRRPSVNEADAMFALRQLFFLLEQMDRQADDPGPRHMVEVTSETWIHLFRPYLRTVQTALAERQ